MTVNCIAPGFIKTEMNSMLSDEAVEEIIEKTPLGRAGEPDDIAGVMLFLASPASDFITGQTITVDGGYIL
jgi:3-oxoacyl-[acyl-carrier protein] reductase